MDFTELQAHLTREYGLLGSAVATADPDASVPTCPDWTVTDLVGHMAEVYLHKAECIRLRAFPDPWPPARGTEPPAAVLAGAWRALTEQLAVHAPQDEAATWYGPDQTVGFWIRRMAQETVIHRVDAQLAAGVPVTPIPSDLAVDGVDEVLTIFLRWACEQWPEDFEAILVGSDGRAVHLRTGDASWAVTASPAGIDVTSEPTSDPAAYPAASVSTDADTLLRWLWNRTGDETVAIDGDPALVAQLRALMVNATQ